MEGTPGKPCLCRKGCGQGLYPEHSEDGVPRAGAGVLLVFACGGGGGEDARDCLGGTEALAQGLY